LQFVASLHKAGKSSISNSVTTCNTQKYQSWAAFSDLLQGLVCDLCAVEQIQMAKRQEHGFVCMTSDPSHQHMSKLAYQDIQV